MPRHPFTKLAAVLLGTVLLGSSAYAQSKPDAGAEAAFQKFFAAMRANDWAGCAKMMHPEALGEFHSLFLRLSEQDETGQVARLFLGVASREEAAKSTPLSTFENVMKGMIAMNPGMGAIFGGATADVLGSVAEGDVFHVVYRMHMEIEGAKMSKIAVAPFKRHEGAWLGMLTGDMESMMQALGAQLDG